LGEFRKGMGGGKGNSEIREIPIGKIHFGI